MHIKPSLRARCVLAINFFAPSLDVPRLPFPVVVLLVDAVAKYCGALTSAHLRSHYVLEIATRQHPSLAASSGCSATHSKVLHMFTFFFCSRVSCEKSYHSTYPHEPVRPSHRVLRNMPAPICRVGTKREVSRHHYDLRQSCSSDHASKGLFQKVTRPCGDKNVTQVRDTRSGHVYARTRGVAKCKCHAGTMAFRAPCQWIVMWISVETPRIFVQISLSTILLQHLLELKPIMLS